MLWHSALALLVLDGARKQLLRVKAFMDLSDLKPSQKGLMFCRTGTADMLLVIANPHGRKPARLTCLTKFRTTMDFPGKERAITTPPDPLIVARLC